MSKYPSIILPEKSQEYKVMQFAFGNDLYMRFAPTPTTTGASHPEIVQAFAKEIGAKIHNKGSFPYDKFHFLDTSKKIIGAGAGDINLEEKIIIFGAMSANYDIRIDEDHMNEIAKTMPGWTFEHYAFYTRRDKDLLPHYRRLKLKK